MKILFISLALAFNFDFCKVGHERMIEKYLDDYPNHMISVKGHECLNDTIFIGKLRVRNLESNDSFCERVIITPNTFKSLTIDCDAN